MSIPLRIIDKPPHDAWEPGMMWRYPPGDIPERECWWIVLPNTRTESPYSEVEVVWTTTDRASSPPHELWSVTGTPPNLTVTPSIDVMFFRIEGQQTVRDGSYWHGFITNGVITP